MDSSATALRLAETLLPGGAGFPAFAATAAGPLLLQRLPPAQAAQLAGALAAHAPTRPGQPWAEAAARLEALEPRLFAEFRRLAYLAYYEQPAVIGAIRALGHPYNDAPLPDGYPTAPFDPAADTPTHGRGRWTPTDQVRPVDTASLNLECLR